MPVIMRQILVLILATCFFSTAQGQRKQKSWKDYLSFANATEVEVSSDKIYCVTEGGLFFYDIQDNSVNKYSVLNGLSDFGINKIAYSEENKVLVVAYNNSNIDLIYNSAVINLSDIKRKQITGDKAVYNITVEGNEAFVSCGFGIVVLNLDKREVKDTYFIGEGGAALRVNDVEIFGELIYAATDNGILWADKNDNLLNYNNWYKTETIPHNAEKFNHLAVHSGKLLANYTQDKYGQDIIYQLDGNEWKIYLPQINYVRDMQVNNNNLVVTAWASVYLVDSNDDISGVLNSYHLNESEITTITPRSAAIIDDGSIWIADFENGLIHVSGNTFESIFPNGPFDNRIFSLYTNNGDLWVAPGGRDESWTNIWQQPRFQLYRNEEWKYFDKTKYPELNGFVDIVNIVADPRDPDHIFVASWGGGLLEFRGDQFLHRYTHKNSPLETVLPPDTAANYVRIGGLDFDSEGNLWIINSEVAKKLLKLTPEGEWESFELPNIEILRNTGQLLVTQNDDKWIVLPRGHNAYVVDKSGTQKKRLVVTSYFNNGEKEIYNNMNDIFLNCRRS